MFKWNDGGRAAAGFKGMAGDCTCRAIAIATGKPYQEVYDDLNAWGARERITKRRKRRGSARTGVHRPTIRRYMESLGWRWVPTMRIGQGCKVHLRADELPAGRLVVSVSRHMTTMIDGVIHDTFDPARDGARCVYGYFVESPSFKPDAYLHVAAKSAQAARRFFGAPAWWPCELAPSKVVSITRPVWRLPAEANGKQLEIR